VKRTTIKSRYKIYTAQSKRSELFKYTHSAYLLRQTCLVRYYFGALERVSRQEAVRQSPKNQICYALRQLIICTPTTPQHLSSRLIRESINCLILCVGMCCRRKHELGILLSSLNKTNVRTIYSDHFERRISGSQRSTTTASSTQSL
jgi:hypothetical protein